MTATSEPTFTGSVADLRIQVAAVLFAVLFGVALAVTVHPIAAVIAIPAIRLVTLERLWKPRPQSSTI